MVVVGSGGIATVLEASGAQIDATPRTTPTPDDVTRFGNPVMAHVKLVPLLLKIVYVLFRDVRGVRTVYVLVVVTDPVSVMVPVLVGYVVGKYPFSGTVPCDVAGGVYATTIEIPALTAVITYVWFKFAWMVDPG